MEFFIKKNATLPVLLMQVVKDGRSEYQQFMDLLTTSTIAFSMIDTTTGMYKIASQPADIVEKTLLNPQASPEYYIYYKFTARDTNTPGRYTGEFMLRTDEGNLILPIREELFINIQDSFISTNPCC
jgi:hypothetical protein